MMYDQRLIQLISVILLFLQSVYLILPTWDLLWMDVLIALDVGWAPVSEDIIELC